VFKPSEPSIKDLQNALSDTQNDFYILCCCSCAIFKNKCSTCKKKGKIYVHTARGTKEKAVAVSCICSHCLHLAGSRTAQEQQGTVRDVSLTIGNTEFIHVISLSPLISYSQLKMGAERES
jgi:hypothetical protein